MSHRAAVAGEHAAARERCGGGEAGRPEVVAVLQAVGNEHLHPGSQLPKRARQHRRSAHSVNVVVAVHEDQLAGIDGGRDTVHGLRHVGHRPGIVQVLQARTQECLRRLGLRVAALNQNAGDRFR